MKHGVRSEWTGDLVRSPGIEPGTPTWKEGVLPLNYDRSDITDLVSAAVGVWVKPWLGFVECHAALLGVFYALRAENELW